MPYVGEIRIFAGNFAPVGWMFCEGQAMPISENSTLFNLIGTTYGGDGQSTFNLPDLRGRVPIHQGTGPGQSITHTMGEAAGTESVTLTVQQIPPHNHALMARSEQGNTSNPANAVLAMSSLTPYAPAGGAPSNNMHASSMLPSGGNQPHNNLQPYLCVHFIISLFGVYPSQI
ncbi:MAG: phage tail protein [Candidatus Pristimantibacillus sp.]